MIIYSDTTIRCISCSWQGKRSQLKRGQILDLEQCPGCGKSLVWSDFDDTFLNRENAIVVPNVSRDASAKYLPP